MTRQVPAVSGRWLIDSGLEPDLIFHQGNELPDFAAFTLLGDPSGEELLRRYFRDHVRIAAASGRDVVLETPTWRASPDWGRRLGYALAEVDQLGGPVGDLGQDVAEVAPHAADARHLLFGHRTGVDARRSKRDEVRRRRALPGLVPHVVAIRSRRGAVGLRDADGVPGQADLRL